MSHPRFKIFVSAGHQYVFNLTASNAEIILSSERYLSHGGALNGIASVRANAPNEERSEGRTSRQGEPYFVLKAQNGEVIGTSEMYSSTAARNDGIRSVIKNAPIATVEE